jgi:hypothetical protein
MLQDQLAEAGRVLDDWAEFVAGAPSDTVLVTERLTSQDHGWSGPNGDNAKAALYAGLLEPKVEISSEQPPAFEVAWPDGSKSSVELVSAADALAAIQSEGAADAPCPECTPVHVVKVRLTTHQYNTTRGPTELPSWEFTLREGKVHVYRVAAAHALVIFEGDRAPAVESFSTTPRGNELTIKALGGRCVNLPAEPGPHPAGLNAYAVESDLAVVIFIAADPQPTRDPAATPVICLGVGSIDTYNVQLAEPLGIRTVLDITGTPASRDASWLQPR